MSKLFKWRDSLTKLFVFCLTFFLCEFYFNLSFAFSALLLVLLASHRVYLHLFSHFIFYLFFFGLIFDVCMTAWWLEPSMNECVFTYICKFVIYVCCLTYIRCMYACLYVSCLYTLVSKYILYVVIYVDYCMYTCLLVCMHVRIQYNICNYECKLM